MSIEVVVVGGGVIGLSVAWELSRRGATVHVLERKQVGREASWAGTGMLPSVSQQPTDPLEQLRTLSHHLHAQWAQDLKEITGIDTGYATCGGIYLATQIGEAASLAAQAIDWLDDGVAVQRLGDNEIIALEPSLKPLVDANAVRAAYFLENDCQLRNPRHLAALRSACGTAGVTITESADVVEICSCGVNGIKVVTTGNTFVADKACFCGGAWTGQWLAKWGISSSIYPVRGQMVLLDAKKPLFSRLILEGHRYLVPRSDGRVLIGSNEEEVGFTPGVTADVIAELQQWAYGIVPELKSATIEQTWSGFRPASIDGMPFICAVPQIPSLYLATGHFRAGLHLSCATAVCIANLMFDQQSPVNLDAFRASRGYTATLR